MADYDALAVVLAPAMDGVTELDGARYFATAGYTSRPDDTPASAHFAGRIAEDIEYSREVTCVFWGQTSTRSSIGAIQLINSDGGLDDLRTAPIRDREVSIYRGRLGDAFEDWELCGSGVAERVEFPSLDRCVIVIADRGAVLDRTIQTATYSGTHNSAIQGQSRPVLVGSCLSIPAVLADLADLVYDVSDDASGLSIDRVRFNGVERAETSEWKADGTGFQALISTSGFRVTADASQAADDIESMLEYMLVTRGPLPSGALDTGTISALVTAAPYKLGYFADRPATYRQFLAELMASFGGGWWFNRHNKLAVGRLSDPDSLSSVHTITERDLDLDGTIVVTQDLAPGWSNICAGQRNWYVHQPNEIASRLTDPTYTQIAADLQQDYRVRRVGVPSGSSDADADLETAGRLGAGISFDFQSRRNDNTGIGTLLIAAVDIQATATRWVRLHEVRRSFWDLPVLASPGAAVAELEPFQCVTLQFDADPPIQGWTERYGLATPKKLQVVGIRGRFLGGRIELRLWG